MEHVRAEMDVLRNGCALERPRVDAEMAFAHAGYVDER